MKLLAVRCSACLALGLGLLAASQVNADVIPESKVPAKVRAAAEKAVPKAKWTDFSKESEDGEMWFELEGTDAQKRYVYVTVTAEGVVGEVMTEVKAKDLPKAVVAALSAKLPRYKVATYYEVRSDGKVTRYDLEGKRPRDKEDITVSVSADGKTVEIDE
jgi:uncharacterized protein YxeA